MLPYERSLVQRLQGKPFALIGVNSDGPEDLRKALKDNPITWRSFRGYWPQKGRRTISDQWKVDGWPTLYLIDHRGIIRKRWSGDVGKTLDREIDKLVGAAQASR